MSWLSKLVVGYVALFVAFCVVWLVALKVLRWRTERRFRRYLAELQAEADELIERATLARLAGEA